MPPRRSPARPRAPKAARTDKLAQHLRAAERAFLEEHLRYHHGNIAATAADVGIGRRALEMKMDLHDLRGMAGDLRRMTGISGPR